MVSALDNMHIDNCVLIIVVNGKIMHIMYCCCFFFPYAHFFNLDVITVELHVDHIF